MVTILRLQLDLNRQLVPTRPDAHHLTGLHHLLQVQQGRQSGAADVHYDGQGRVLVDAQHRTGVLQERICRLDPHLGRQKITIGRGLDAVRKVHESAHQVEDLLLEARHELGEVCAGVRDSLGVGVPATQQHLHEGQPMQFELHRAVLQLQPRRVLRGPGQGQI